MIQCDVDASLQRWLQFVGLPGCDIENIKARNCGDGGILNIERSFVGGTVPVNPPRKPTLHLWKNAEWRANGNWYDLESAHVGPTSFEATQRTAYRELSPVSEIVSLD